MKTGRIYKIITNQGTEIYVGSTFNELRQRFKMHKADYKKWKDNKRSSNITAFELFDKYGVANCKMILIKEYEVCDRAHLEVYEALWIKKLRAINKNLPFGKGIKYLDKQYQKQYRTNNQDKSKEYYEKNKDKISERKKEYYEANKEILKQKKKLYREANKEILKQYAQDNKEIISEKSKARYQKNKAEICEKRKIYREANKQSINEKHKQKIQCECGVTIRKDGLIEHKKSAKHMNAMH